jgi:hypothetical protein
MKNIIKQLPMVKQLLEMKRDLALIRHKADQQHRIIQEAYFHQLKTSPRYADPRHLIHFEGQVYSQNGEDGIIAEIFNRIGTTNRNFVELGSASGLENNTALLLLEKWSGLWAEGNQDACDEARQHWAEPIDEGRLKIINTIITADNLEGLLKENKIHKEPDLLSLDIDRNTFHVFEKMSEFQPRLFIIEYNGVFPVSSKWGMDYKDNKDWDGTYRFGATLKKFELAAKKKGYSLICCDSTGTNAFFVRNDVLGDHFLQPFTTEFHYEPYRQFLLREMPYPKISRNARRQD